MPPIPSKSSSSLRNEEPVAGHSPLESLPRDVFWQIIDYVPYAAPKLKQTSKTIKSRMDEHTLLSQRGARRIVDKLLFVESCHHFEDNNEHTINIQLFVPIRFSKAFDLLMLADPTLNLVDRMDRSQFGHTAIKYRIDVDMDTDGIAVLEHIRECIGTQRLKFSVCKLTDALADNLTRAICDYGVEWLSMTVRHVVVNDPESVLLALSTLVRALHIDQKEAISSPGKNYFFGLVDEEFAPIILEMFSRKLDKLCIHNSAYIRYLTLECAEILREQLPLVGKKIWFDAACPAYSRDFTSVVNDHFVQGNGWYYRNNKMVIKHRSRVDETFEV